MKQIYPPLPHPCQTCGKTMTFSAKDIKKMKELLDKEWTFREVADKYGVDPGTINHFTKRF